jgi:hypothetical protein
MRIQFLIVAFICGLAWCLFPNLSAQEETKVSAPAANLPTKLSHIETTDGREFKNASVTKVEPDGITIDTDDGVEKIPFVLLPPDIQKKFNYDPQKSAAYAAANAKAQADAVEQSKLALQQQQEAQAAKIRQNQQIMQQQAAEAKAAALAKQNQQAMIAKVTQKPPPGETSTPGVHVLRVSGRVLQVLKNGILLGDWTNETLEPYKDEKGIWHGGGNEMDEPLMIVGDSSNFVDGDKYNGVVYPAGKFSYTNTLGATKTIWRYATSPELALKYLNEDEQ